MAPSAHASFPWSSLILPTVSLLCGFRSRGTLFLLDEDGEVGAPKLARHADRALVDVHHLHLEHVHPQHLGGTQLDADLASLAVSRDDADLDLRTLGRLDLLRSLFLRHRSGPFL